MCTVNRQHTANIDEHTCNRVLEALFSRGIVDIKISMAIKKEQMGSARVHPQTWMMNDDIMTPTLPNVSANKCKNTPVVMVKPNNTYFLVPCKFSLCS